MASLISDETLTNITFLSIKLILVLKNLKEVYVAELPIGTRDRWIGQTKLVIWNLKFLDLVK